jgi:hypothetical protein
VDFIPFGRLSGLDEQQLAHDMTITGCSHVEAHFDGGAVLASPAKRLGVFMEQIRAQPGDARCIALTPYNHLRASDKPLKNIYRALFADEAAAREGSNHQRRYLTPSELRESLLAGRAKELATASYAHRQAEILAALAAATSPRVEGSIRAFSGLAERYKTPGVMSTVLPHAAFYTTNCEHVQADDETLEIHLLPCPTAHLDLEGASMSTLPSSTKRTPLDAPSDGNGQLELAM